MTAFEFIKIVLVEPSHPGNIGATARAMANMGLKNLVLVNPTTFPSEVATARAAGADPILTQAKVVSNLGQALTDCAFVVGSSARLRTLPIPLLSPRGAAERIALEAQQHAVAILFGRERTGLTNEELALCHVHLNIPTDQAFSSLNLAQAVQVVAYECRLALLAQPNPLVQDNIHAPVSGEEMIGFYQHLWQTLETVDFFKNKQARQLKLRLQHIFNRTRLDKTEYTILRGIFRSILKKCG